MVCVAVLERLDDQRWMRDAGIDAAACKLQSLARLVKVTNVMRRVWGKAREIHMKLLQREAQAAAEERARRLAAGEADYKDKKKAGAGALLPEKLVYPRLLAAYRPSKESDPVGKGSQTLDVLLSVMSRQSNFGEIFSEQGGVGDRSSLLVVRAFVTKQPALLSSRVSRRQLSDARDDVHGEVLLLVYDRRLEGRRGDAWAWGR